MYHLANNKLVLFIKVPDWKLDFFFPEAMSSAIYLKIQIPKLQDEVKHYTEISWHFVNQKRKYVNFKMQLQKL